MSALVFMDTETTGLALTDDIWEFAGIRREEDGTQTELHLFIEHDNKKCLDLPDSFYKDHMDRWSEEDAVSTEFAAQAIAGFMGGKAHIVGAVPNFDTERISLLLKSAGFYPAWHYHLIDVENLAVGYLQGTSRGRDEKWNRMRQRATGVAIPLSLPWNSDDLSRALGVQPPTDARHTAMGDALWAMAIYDRVMGVTS